MRPLFLFLLVLIHFPLSAESPLAVVGFEYRAPTLVVEARVNGSEPLPFAFDTGSTACLIDSTVARRLGLRPTQASKTGGSQFARGSIAVGGAEAPDLPLAIRDLGPLSDRVGVELAGIIGFTWMDRFVLRLDYGQRRLTVWPRSYEPVARADQMPLPLELHSAPQFAGASLYVRGSLEGESCPLLLDTGTGRGVLGKQMAERLGVELEPIHSAEEGGGLPTHVVGRVALAGRLFTNVRFTFDPRRGKEGSPYNQCVIGNEQLQAFVLILDIPHRRAIFEPLLPIAGAP